jgi:hypothetical protein
VAWQEAPLSKQDLIKLLVRCAVRRDLKGLCHPFKDSYAVERYQPLAAEISDLKCQERLTIDK